jgi:hypothetical protein
MKRLCLTLFCASLAGPLFADGTNQLTDEKSRVSYALGLSIGHFYKQRGLDLDSVDPDAVGRAIRDVLGGGNELLTDAETKEVPSGDRPPGGGEEQGAGGSVSEHQQTDFGHQAHEREAAQRPER